MERTVKIRRVYPHPVERVWDALTDSATIAAWLMPNDFEPRVGHDFTLTAEPAPGFDGIVKCRVLEIDEPQRMVWSWRGGPIDTVLSFELRPEGSGTELLVTQSGFRGFKPVLVSFILGSGSRSIYGKLLPAVLDRLAAGESPAPADPADESCEDDGMWRVWSWLFTPFLRGRSRTSKNEKDS